MNRIDRLHAILILLQSRRIVTAKEIAERFELSLRSVYRDIKALNESGVPIGSEAGLGYFLDRSYNLPPIMFSTEEAMSLMLGAKLVQGTTSGEAGSAMESALLKIRSTLKSADKDTLEELDRSITVQSDQQKTHLPPLPSVIPVLQKAIAECKQLQIEYVSGYKNEITERIIEPVGMTWYMESWHIIAWCTLRKDYRDFRSDRITSLNMTDVRFNKQNHTSLDEYLKTLQFPVNAEKVKVAVNPATARSMYFSRRFFGFLEEEVHESKAILTFSVPWVNYFSRWLISFGSGVLHIDNEDVKHTIRVLLEELNSIYKI